MPNIRIALSPKTAPSKKNQRTACKTYNFPSGKRQSTRAIQRTLRQQRSGSIFICTASHRQFVIRLVVTRSNLAFWRRARAPTLTHVRLPTFQAIFLSFRASVRLLFRHYSLLLFASLFLLLCRSHSNSLSVSIITILLLVFVVGDFLFHFDLVRSNGTWHPLTTVGDAFVTTLTPSE